MSSRPLLVTLGVVLLTGASARAQSDGSSVQLSPFAGYAFGGSVRDTVFEEDRGFESSLDYGAAINFRIGQTWRFELLYSRQETRLEDGLGPALDVTLERYLVGLQEEKGEGSVRWFGTFYLGATRFVPGPGFEAQTKFTGGVGLGLKSYFTPTVGVRLEARGYYTVVESEGGAFCANGNCLFAFSASGLWQGALSAGLVLAF